MRLMVVPLVAACALAATMTPVHAAGNFTPNLWLKSGASSGPVFSIKDVEPEVRVDSSGRIFVSAIHGVPGGTDLFQVASNGLSYTYRGEPDGLPVFNPTGLAPGGGDTDLAIGSFNPRIPGTPGPLTITSLNLGTVYSSFTNDAGATYTPGGNAAGAFFGVDRQWNNAFGGLERYNVVHAEAGGNIQFARSLDGGLIWVNGTPVDGPIAATSTDNNELGPIVVDQNHQPNQILYEVFVSVATPQENALGLPFHTVWVGRSDDDGVTWTDHMVYNGPTTASFNHIFPSLAIDANGNLFAVWSNDHDVMYSYSKDHANTWSAAYRVTNSAKDGGYATHIFPWVAAGYYGGIDIVYYETTGANPNLSTDKWVVGMAQNRNVFTNPTAFSYFVASDHVIHTGQICESGIGCDSTQPGNRNLADDFQVALDRSGHANITFTDDHNTTIPPQTYFTKQIYGYSLGTPNGDGRNYGAVAKGKTAATAGVAANLPVLMTLKAPQAASQGWMTLVVSNAIRAGGYVTKFTPISANSATFSGTDYRTHVPFSGSLQNGTLTVLVGTTTYSATISAGTFALM